MLQRDMLIRASVQSLRVGLPFNADPRVTNNNQRRSRAVCVAGSSNRFPADNARRHLPGGLGLAFSLVDFGTHRKYMKVIC